VVEAKRSRDAVAVQAWFDPKSRKLVYNFSTLRVGILTASSEAITFVMPPAEVLFVADPRNVILKWSPLTLSMTATVAARVHRIYFNPPKSSLSIGSAPSLTEKEKVELDELFVTSTKIGELAGAHGTLFDSLKSLSETVEIVGLLSQAFAMYGGAKSYYKVHKALTASEV
jgi:hypothetical protein